MGMQKKLDQAREEGIQIGLQQKLEQLVVNQAIQEEVSKAWLDGIKVGAEASGEVWLSAIRNTKGIGPKMLEKISEQAKLEHTQRTVERKLLAQKGISDERTGTEHQDSSIQEDRRGAC